MFWNMNGVGFRLIIMHILVTYVDKGSTNQDAEPCSTEVISIKEDECFARYNLSDVFVNGLPVPFLLSYSKNKLKTLCTNIEDITRCIKDVMGSCNHTYFDYGVYETTLLTICSNQQELMIAETNCNISILEICLKYYHNAVIDLRKHLDITHPVTADLCLIFKNTRKCINIEESTSCHRRHSQLMTSLYRNRFRPTLCDDIAVNSNPVFESSMTILCIMNAVQFMFYHIYNK